MAAAIGYSGPGISKAIDKESLSFNQVKSIAEETGFKEDFVKLFETNANEGKVSESGVNSTPKTILDVLSSSIFFTSSLENPINFLSPL